MRFAVSHATRYRYSGAVYLEPQVIRLHPRSGDGVHIHRFDIECDPSPVGHFCTRDLDGNIVHQMWFGGVTESFSVSTYFEAETQPFNPLDFLIQPHESRLLPVGYGSDLAPLVAPYLVRCSSTVPVTAFATTIAQEVGHETIPFLTTLCQRIHGMCERVRRVDGPPQMPADTLQQMRGACRDFAVLYIDACRAVGLAARFVSGYRLDHDDQQERDLHAWAEVYIPGGGWRGFDPCTGLATAQYHAAVAAGRISALAAPIFGTFRASGVQAELDTEVQVRALPEDALAHA